MEMGIPEDEDFEGLEGSVYFSNSGALSLRFARTSIRAFVLDALQKPRRVEVDANDELRERFFLSLFQYLPLTSRCRFVFVL